MRISKELDGEWRVVGPAQPEFACLTVGWDEHTMSVQSRQRACKSPRQ